jgi:hypothetical protein
MSKSNIAHAEFRDIPEDIIYSWKVLYPNYHASQISMVILLFATCKRYYAMMDKRILVWLHKRCCNIREAFNRSCLLIKKTKVWYENFPKYVSLPHRRCCRTEWHIYSRVAHSSDWHSDEWFPHVDCHANNTRLVAIERLPPVAKKETTGDNHWRLRFRLWRYCAHHVLATYLQ